MKIGGSHATSSPQKLSLPENQKITTRPYDKRDRQEQCTPQWIPRSGLIINESKQKWREEILITSVGYPGVFTGALQSPRSMRLGKDPAIWLLAPVLPRIRRVPGWAISSRYKAGLGGPDTFYSHFTHQLRTHMSQSHPLLKAASKPSFQFVVEREGSALGFWSSLGSLQFQFSGWQPHCQWSQRK